MSDTLEVNRESISEIRLWGNGALVAAIVAFGVLPALPCRWTASLAMMSNEIESCCSVLIDGRTYLWQQLEGIIERTGLRKSDAAG
jgi:hypothetical protein